MKFRLSPRRSISALHSKYSRLPRKARYPIAGLMLVGLFAVSAVGGAASTYVFQDGGEQASASNVLGAKTKQKEPELSAGSAIITRDSSVTQQVAADAAEAAARPSSPTSNTTKPAATPQPVTPKAPQQPPVIQPVTPAPVTEQPTQDEPKDEDEPKDKPAAPTEQQTPVPAT